MADVNEFQLGLDTSALASTSAQSAQSAQVYSGGNSVVVGDPVDYPPPATEVPKRTISVYANSINAVSYDVSGEVACFDIVFSVGIMDSDGSACKTYQVVKRIGIDKEKIAGEVKDSSPVTVVEASKPEPKKVINEGRSKPSELERFRRIAGLG
jgi:hypothetical protein